jgi:hypothetical protein
MTARRSHAVILSLAGLLACACGFPPADFTVVITQPDHSYTVRIYDASDLVDGASSVGSLLSAPTDGVVAHPESKSLDIHWLGGECKRTPVIHIEGTATALTVTVEPDATEGIPFIGACAAVGIYLGVTLSLQAAVSQGSVTFVER